MPTDKIFRTLPFGDFYYFGKILCSTFPRQKTHNHILIMEPHTHISQPTWRHFILLFPMYLLVRLWQATIRMRASDAKSLENLEDKKRLIGLAWHNRIFFLPMCKYIFRPNFPMSGLVSASRDGAWLCAFFKFLGIGTVRGSSKRRGAHAIISMVETLQHTSDIFITPDGPRGPRYVCKPGFLSVAKSSGARILMLRITPSSFWTINATWDKFILPKPFSRVTVDAVNFDNYESFVAEAEKNGKSPVDFAAHILSGE